MEISSVGSDETPDLAVLRALKTAVEKETRVLVDSKTLVYNGELISETIITRSTAYITRYRVIKLVKHKSKWVAHVACVVNENALINDLFPSNSNKSLGLNGPLLGIKVAQFYGDVAYKQTKQQERQLASNNELKILRLFMENLEFRRKYPISIKRISPRFSDKDFSLCVDLDISRPYTKFHKNFFTVGVDYLFFRAQFKDSTGKILHTQDVIGYYPWKQIVVPGPTDSKLITKTKLLSIIWI